jgi:hypothetical protein
VQATQVRDYYGRKDLPWYSDMEGVAATTVVLTLANMISEPSKGKLIEQGDLQERRKRDRECEQPSQGSPCQVKSKRKQVLKMKKTKVGTRQQYRRA